MLTLRQLLPLGALALLPLAVPAATIPIASGEICWDDEVPPIPFPNGFLAYDYLCSFSMQVGDNPASGGFTSLLGLDGSRLSFEAGGLQLRDYSPPDSTGPIFLEYRASDNPDPDNPDLDPGWAMFWLESTDPDTPYPFEALLYGELVSLRFEADSFPPLDGVHQMRARAHFVLDHIGIDEDPLAEALYAQLMELSGDTGNLYLDVMATLNQDASFSFGETALSTVPEPRTVAAVFAVAALAVGLLRRRIRA